MVYTNEKGEVFFSHHWMLVSFEPGEAHQKCLSCRQTGTTGTSLKELGALPRWGCKERPH